MFGFGWIMVAASVLVMARVAEAEDRSAILWALLILLLCIGAAATIPLPLINIFLGFAASFLIMFALNVAQG